MPATTDNSSIGFEPMSAVLVRIFIATFSFLTALCIKEVVSDIITIFAPHDEYKKLLYTALSACLFLFVTVALAFTWQDCVNV